MTTRLVLFDIDGTLLSTNGQAVVAMVNAYKEVYGLVPPNDGHLMDGKTELQIVHELLALAGLTREQVEEKLPQFWAVYEREVSQVMQPEKMTVYPGVRELLAQLQKKEDCVVGLLTGNIEATSWLKLKCANLDGFACGGYGQFNEKRGELPALALADAERVTGKRFSGREVTIIGDTPADIHCGKPLGLKSIAVATAFYSREALATHQPDALFDDLSDTGAVIKAIEAP